MRFLNILLSVFFLATVVLHSSDSIQCYVCTNQYENLDKCQNTVKYCAEEEDVRCLSEISWKRPLDWVPEPTRHYGLTKSCTTKAKCDSLKDKTRFNCTHNNNDDWNCAECCEGNLCNYHITLKGSAVQSNLLLIIGCIAVFAGVYMLQTIKE